MKIANSVPKQKEQTPQRGSVVQALWKCTPVQLVWRPSSFRLVLPILGRCAVNCRRFFCWNSCANWCQDEIKISVKIYAMAQVKLRSSKSALESKTEAHSYNNWAMRSFFLLEAVCAEFNGEGEKPGSFFSSSSNPLPPPTSWLHLFPSVLTQEPKGERNRRGGQRASGEKFTGAQKWDSRC